MAVCLCRGPEFRKDYSCLSEIRSILPKSVNVMSLSATVSPLMKGKIMESLSMSSSDCVVIEEIPNKPNIKYTVQKMPKDACTLLSPILSDIQENGLNAQKSIIFCRTYADFNEISTAVVSTLHESGMSHLLMPEGEVQPICQMFSACTEEKVKNNIITAFTDPQSTLRVVIATIAFGMGLDAPNVYRIIHYGPSDSIEAYLQETGRCGRDGSDSSATLYFRKRDLASNSPITATMRSYCSNSTICLRKLLMQVFESQKVVNIPSPIHKCCDICQQECTCTTCSLSVSVTTTQDSSILPNALRQPLSRYEQQTLTRLLKIYREGQCGGQDSLLFGDEVASGISDNAISAIVKTAQTINSPRCIAELGIVNVTQCRQMYDIVNSMY